MYQKERADKILRILQENGYVTVKYLCDEIGYSKATINRDLNVLAKQKLVSRSYGGVELVKSKSVPLKFRYHKMKAEKKHICKAAAELVEDGDRIFIDSSSTTEFMAPYLLDKKDITVISSNMAVLARLSGLSNIKAICLGGEVLEKPSMLGGDLCIKNALEYKADKFFFSTNGISEDGELTDGGTYVLLIQVMTKNAKQVIYLADHTKACVRSNVVVMTVDKVDTIITDCKFEDSFKEKYRHVTFIEV